MQKKGEKMHYIYKSPSHLKFLKSLLLSSIALASIFSSCIFDDDKSNGLPSNFVIKSEYLYPEGIAFDKNQGLFFITSLGKGIISKVSISGQISTFISDSTLKSAVGIHVNNGKLYVCNSDPGAATNSTASTVGKLANLHIYDAKNGVLINKFELGSILPDTSMNHLANDVTTDANGNIYITDSFSPIIYKVTASGIKSIFVNDSRFAITQGFGLNGIVYHPNGYLIVAHSVLGKLYKISLDGASINEISIGDTLTGADGIALIDASTIAVVKNDLELKDNRVVRIKTSNNWQSGQIVGTFNTMNNFPTTATIAQGKVYVLFAQLHELFVKGNQKFADFSIQKATF